MIYLYINYTGKLCTEKGNSDIIYLKETFTMQQFSSSVWNVSNYVTKSLRSKENSVILDVEVFPNGRLPADENFIGVHLKLFSQQRHCYGAHFQLSVLTANGVLIYEYFLSNRWSGFVSDYELSQFITRQKCKDFIYGYAEQDIIKIMVELFCWSFQELVVENAIIPSTANSIEMIYYWSICDLKALTNASKVRLISGPFQSDIFQAKFHLQMLLRCDAGNTGDIELIICLDVFNFAFGSSIFLPVYSTLTVKEYGPENETLRHGPSKHVFDLNANSCWKALSSVYLEKLIRKRCFTVEYYGVYYLSNPI